MKTKAKSVRCKHSWYQTAFIGNPFTQSYFSFTCKVIERCASCTKERERIANEEEFQAEIKRLTCQTCGFRVSEHGNNGCLRLLGDEIRELQERVKSLSEWRHGY